MFEAFLSITLSFFIAFFTLPVIIRIARQRSLYDVPDARKIHTTQIASLGGFAIFAGFILATLLSMPYPHAIEFQYYIAASLIIFFLGLNDDILSLSPYKKFAGQLLAAFLIIYKGGISLNGMHGILNLRELPPSIDLILTYFTVILIINAFNLIDGIDGLAGSLGLMASLILGIYFFKVNLIPYGILSLSLSGSLLAFLIFNFHPAQIFMGDCGSLLVGLIISILVIKFINVAPGNEVLPFTASPAIAFSLLLIPLLDTFRLFSLRILSGHSPFIPDRNHIHHILLRKGFSHRKITLMLVSINLLFISFACVASSMGNSWIIFIQASLFFIAISLLCPTYFKRHSPADKPIRRASVKSIPISESIAISRDSVLFQEN